MIKGNFRQKGQCEHLARPRDRARSFHLKSRFFMLAMDYRDPWRVRAVQKPMPEIKHPEDAIVRVTRACICGSDLHLYKGNESIKKRGAVGLNGCQHGFCRQWP